MKVKKKSFFSFVEALGNNVGAKWAVFTIYFAIVVFLVMHHEPWGDEFWVWYMDYNMSFGELIDAMREEGHFCLWHLCVLPWVKLFGMDYHALYMASIPLMSIATWLLLFKVDFSFWGKLFIIFSAPFIYHFPVIARCYALIPPIIVAIVAVYQRKNSPYLYCLLIGLLAHTHVYMEGLVAILWILFVYRYVIQIWKSDRVRAKHNLVASAITVLLVFLAFLQVVGGVADGANGIGPAFKETIDSELWIARFFSYHRFRLFKTLHTHFGCMVPDLDLAITLFAYCAIAFCVSLYVDKRDKKERANLLWIISVGVLWQVFFATNIYHMMLQRVYLVCIPVFLIIGMGYSKSMTKYSVLIPLLFWLMNTPCQYVVVQDIFQEYCYDIRCAADIERIIPEEAVVFTTGDVSSVQLIKRKIDYIELCENDSSVTAQSIINSMPFDSVGEVFLITSHIIEEKANVGISVIPVYSGIEGNGEMSYYPLEKPISMYKIIRYETDY